MITEIFVDTNEIIEREPTKEELAQREKDRITFEAAEVEREAAEVDKNKKRAELLERLGINEDEAKLLLS
jgi:hypothetical protein